MLAPRAPSGHRPQWRCVGLICIRLTSRKQISIPPCFTAHCASLSAIGNPTGNVVTSTMHATRALYHFSSRRALDGPLSHTSRLTVTAWLGLPIHRRSAFVLKHKGLSPLYSHRANGCP
nr:hypothetical protein [uncultured bacterium]